jgi:hypothetical protein
MRRPRLPTRAAARYVSAIDNPRRQERDDVPARQALRLQGRLGRKQDVVGWITIRVVLFGGALATLCGSGLLDPSIFSPI